MTIHHRLIVVTVAAIATVTGLITYQLAREKLLTPEQLQAMGTVFFNTPRVFTMDNLISHHGKAFTHDNLKGKWTLAYFGYTFCPDICPTTLSQLNAVDKLLKSDNIAWADTIQYVLFSIDPERDTVEKLAQYVPYFNPDFIGVTGSIKAIHTLTRQLNIAFTPVVNNSDEFYLVDHSANLVIINPQGDYHGFIKPPFTREKLKRILEEMVRSFY
ncbi:SCO1 protein [invertebrate metagenome]|uniref:SCO1 protein n=1 Tax=invertebrate metagenome TaxID=1711999 RepID=A0A2H9T8N1_9ZZZZ